MLAQRGNAEQANATQAPPEQSDQRVEDVQSPTNAPEQQGQRDDVQQNDIVRADQPVVQDVSRPVVNKSTVESGEPIDRTDWKARYEGLRSHRDDEHQAALNELTTLRQRVAELEKANPQASQSPQRFELDEETRSYLGETEAKVIEKLNESFDARVAKLEEREQKIIQSQKAAFESEMDRLVQGWRSLDSDPVFTEWLDRVDPSIGFAQRRTLNAALASYNAASAAQVVREFVQYRDGQEQPIQAPAVQQQVLDVQTGGPDSSAGQMQQGNTYTVNDLATHYEEKSRLHRSGRLYGATLERVMARENELKLAQREGRMTS